MYVEKALEKIRTLREFPPADSVNDTEVRISVDINSHFKILCSGQTGDTQWRSISKQALKIRLFLLRHWGGSSSGSHCPVGPTILQNQMVTSVHHLLFLIEYVIENEVDLKIYFTLLGPPFHLGNILCVDCEPKWDLGAEEVPWSRGSRHTCSPEVQK